MKKEKKYEKMENFTVRTLMNGETKLSDIIAEGKTAIIFLRYYGCTLCQYDIYIYNKYYEEIVPASGKILIVLQSSIKNIESSLEGKNLKTDIIADNNLEMYRKLKIMPAKSKEELVDENTVKKIIEARKLFSHGEYEGEELQLPAVFIVNKDLEILYKKYGESAGDVPTPQELKKLFE